MTDRELFKKVYERLAGVVGEDDARVDARELIRFSGGDDGKLEDSIARRLSGEPLQYIIGEWDFYNCTFRVGEGVLIPRPETEFIVEKTLEFLKARGGSARVLDLCSGSGCIAISIAANHPDCKVFAVEKSPAAMEYLKQNMALNGVKDSVTAFCDDMLSGCGYIVSKAKGNFDVIVSNPPYIRSDECETLQREVMHEPRLALDGGEDGLVFYRAFAERFLPLLKPDGMFLVECGEDEADEIAGIFRDYYSGEIIKQEDFHCIPRFVGNIP